ncbi:MAG: heparinase II/III family protein [Hyphomicrobium sp.]|nr:heparinase II/III family protein [Hyphomicrobium sp.]
MAGLSLAEKSRIALIAAKRSQRASMARLQFSPLLRWRFGSANLGNLLIVPQSLRNADPSFWPEMKLGHMGLAGIGMSLRSGSPFQIQHAPEAWVRALHGFGWLRHLEATGDDEARSLARNLTVEWTRRQRGSGIVWEPAVLGRRIISWLSHANFLLDEANIETYDAISSSLGAQIVRLAATWRDGPDGYPRLLALTGLVLSYLCVSGHDPQLDEIEKMFSAEIERQFLEDGGHISRNPAVLVDLLLDFLPTRQCFAARGRKPPSSLLQTLCDAVAFLRFMRLGDGRLARFNGVSVASPAGLATVLAYDDLFAKPLASARPSGYVNLRRGATTIIADAGVPPPFEFANAAHAGCLSFEMSAGARLLFVNGGAPASSDQDWRPQARGTASHNTMCVNETSSAKLVRHRGLEAMIGGAPIRGPLEVKSTLEEANGDLVWTASHNGYLGRFGLIHHRKMTLSASGAAIRGIDRLTGDETPLRLKSDLPYAIHFHLHPEITCRLLNSPGEAEIVTPEGQVWRFFSSGAALSIEEGIYFADSSGPRRALQFVLRGTTFGDTEVSWTVDTRA